MTAAAILSRFLGVLWFRRMRVEGPPLPEGPVLLVLNHPNALMDPLVAAALLPRTPRFVAKATLWKQPVLRPFLALFNPIPVHRAQEGGDAGATEKTFAAVHEAFAQGAIVGLFPEGISHGMPDLAPLKTGTARLALSCPGPLSVVPAGLVYGERRLFRQGVLLRLGEAVPFEDLKPRGLEPENVRAFTARIREALKPLTLHGTEAERLKLARNLAWLLAEASSSVSDLEAFRHRVQSLLPKLEAMGAEDRARLRHRVRAAQRWLRASGLRPDQVGHPYPFQEVAAWVPRAALRLALAPVLLPFALLFAPPVWIVDRAVRALAREIDMVATTGIFAGLLFLLLWTGLGAALLLHEGRPWGLAPLAWIPAFLGLRLFERIREDVQAVRGFRARMAKAAPRLLDAKRMLLEAFPELR
ncbi:MAG TPA: 1-acyl-sn-glycerol-3-phosphate acyltransferase [Holophagaceae bacterium]|jgi:glycerol-3-phosphate O-acyltransferase/dihydroxyacetone phosphate acyltransferase|nr:1-acyl-sn-glycerol-3-phosphate acyltransferase [Holophagaceae bacterium]